MPPILFPRKNNYEYIEKVFHIIKLFLEEKIMFTAIMQIIGAAIFTGFVTYKITMIGRAFDNPAKTVLTYTEYCAWKSIQGA